MIESAPYSAAASFWDSSSDCWLIQVVRYRQRAGVHVDAEGATLESCEERLVRAGEEGLDAERFDFVEQRGPSIGVEVRGDFIEQDYRSRRGFDT